MIRRIQTTNDLLDVIKSCPSGVIDDIYKIEYYIQGFDTVYEAEFTHEGDCLKVVLPSSELEKLESGILMRRAYYKVSDSSYPDGYYNLTFEDNMNVWLGGESSDPYERQYVTEKVLNETLEDYALKTEIPDVSGYATQSWVESKGYVTAETLPEGIATESWVQSQGFLTEHQDLTGYALKSEIPDVSGYATQEWVNAQGYLTQHQDLSSYALKSEIPSLDGYATEEWVENSMEQKKQVFNISINLDGPSVITSYDEYMNIAAYIRSNGIDSVRINLVDISGQFFPVTSIEVNAQNMILTAIGSYYSFDKMYIRIINNDSARSPQISAGNLVDANWVLAQGYATQTWVNNKGYLTEHQTLKTINGQSIVGSGNITIQATGGVTEEWLQTNLKTINGESLIGVGDMNIQKPIEIGIDIDSGQLLMTYDEYKAMIDEYANDGGYTRKLMIYFGSDTTGRQYSSYPSDVEYRPDGTIEIGGCFLDDRDENNKKLVYYRIKGNDATQTVDISLTPVSSGGDIPSLDGYATQEWVISQGYITSIPDTYATKTWVSSQGYLTSHQDLSSYALKSEIPSLDGYATQTWVTSQGYLTEHQDLTGYALKSEIPSLDGYATQSWVSSQQFATQSWVSSQNYLTEHQDLTGYALKSEIPSLDGYATQSWVTSQGYLTEHQDLTGYATQSWVSSQQFATQSWVSSQGYLTEHQDLSSYALKSEIPSLDGYATQSWVTSQGYLTEHQDLTGYATQNWVSSQQFATQSWVSSQGYLTEHQDLSSYALKSEIPSLDGYATQSWATSQFLEESKIWTGTQSAWDALTSSQKASYTIALITE